MLGERRGEAPPLRARAGCSIGAKKIREIEKKIRKMEAKKLREMEASEQWRKTRERRKSAAIRTPGKGKIRW